MVNFIFVKRKVLFLAAEIDFFGAKQQQQQQQQWQ